MTPRARRIREERSNHSYAVYGTLVDPPHGYLYRGTAGRYVPVLYWNSTPPLYMSYTGNFAAL
eukprot:SAG11_NODE_15273_length_583_cov_1.126033_1_plen_62_part_01